MVLSVDRPAPEELAALLDRLYRRHHEAVFHLAMRYGLGNESWAEDVTQDVFIKLLDRLPSLEEREQLDGWLYRVTTNRCLRKLRRERLWSVGIAGRLGAASAPAQDSMEGQVFARHELERARLALAKLPPRERVVLCMCYLDGKSQAQICACLGLSKGYVSKLLARARARLEQELHD